MVLSPNGEVAVAGAEDGVLALYRMPQGEKICDSHVHRGSVDAMAFSPDGRILATASTDRTLRLWNLVEGSLRELLTLGAPTGSVHSVAFSSDGARLFSIARGETAVRVLHLNRLRERLKALDLDWE